MGFCLFIGLIIFFQNPLEITGQFELQKWSPGMVITVTESGQVVVYIKDSKNIGLQWYSTEGSLMYTIESPGGCPHGGVFHNILAVTVSGAEYIALSCCECQVIWLWSPETRSWSIGWQAKDPEESPWSKIRNQYSFHRIVREQLKPWKMCRGSAGEIFVNGINGETMIQLDITKLPFRIHNVSELKFHRKIADNFELDGFKRFLAITDPTTEHVLLCKAGSGASLRVEMEFKVPGCHAVCVDHNKHVFVIRTGKGVFATDSTGVTHIESCGSILVFEGSEISWRRLLQELKHPGMTWPKKVFWCDKIKRLVVLHNLDKVSYFEIKCKFNSPT